MLDQDIEEKSIEQNKRNLHNDFFSEHCDSDGEIYKEYKSKHNVKLQYNIYKEKVEDYNKKEGRKFDKEATFKIIENPEKGGYKGWVKVTTTRRKIGALLKKDEAVTANAAVTK
jgi:hypothetical protein